MNKKAQTGIIAGIILFIMFLVMWFVWLGDFVAEWGHNAVVDNGLSGLDVFLFDNINFFMLIGSLLGIIAFVYLGGRQ